MRASEPDDFGTVRRMIGVARRVRLTVGVAVLLSVGAGISTVAWAGTWHEQLVEAGTVPGAYHALAVDGSGHPHLAYTRIGSISTYHYAKWTGSAWAYSKIDNDPDWSHVRDHTISMAVTAAGKPHVAYFDNANSRLKYAVLSGTTWAKQVVDGNATTRCGEQNAIVLDSKNRPRIIYTTFNNNNFDAELRYAAWNGTSWVFSVVSTGSPDHEWVEDGAAIDFAIETNGQMHALYICVDDRVVIAGYYPKIVRYATSYDGITWCREDLDYSTSDYYRAAYLDLDGENRLHASANLYRPGGFGDLRYAIRTGDVWSAASTIAKGVPFDVGFMVSRSGMPVAGYGNSNFKLLFGGRVGGVWKTQLLKNTGTTGSGECRLAQAPDGRAFLSYYWINTALNRAELRLTQAAPDLWPGVTLAAALDKTATWKTSAPVAWLGQASLSHDGVDAARPDLLGHNGSSWLSTTVTGPATLSFWWKTSSEVGDKLAFYVDSTCKSSLSGISGWKQKSYPIGAGSHTVKWEFKRNASGSAGLNTGFVDQVHIVH